MHSSKFTVVVSLIGNSLVAGAKYVGYFFSGSGALLSEAFHSTADVINQVFLLLGLVRSQRKEDQKHNYGYGKANFFWSFVSALGIFFFGAGLSIYHGVHTLLDPHPESLVLFRKYLPLVLGILTVNFVVDLLILMVALKEINAARQKTPFFTYLRKTSNLTTVAIFLEDLAACLGVLLAASGILLSLLFQSVYLDALSSILIGLMMGTISIFLMIKNKSLLIGKAVHSEERQKIEAILKTYPSIHSIEHTSSMILSSEQFKLRAKIDFDGAYFIQQLSPSEIESYFQKSKDLQGFRKTLEKIAEQVVENLARESEKIEEHLKKEFPQLSDLEIENT